MSDGGRKKQITDPGRRDHPENRDLLASLHHRLSEFHANFGGGPGSQRNDIIKAQAEFACSCADETGRLVHSEFTFEELLPKLGEVRSGAEHIVELQDVSSGAVGKITVPPGFGVMPVVRHLALHEHRGDSIEYDSATPLEYLDRWMASNAMFGDQVELRSVIKWADGRVSFSVKQPHYPGTHATASEIRESFIKAGWTSVADPRNEYTIFYNFAFDLLAFDAVPRNCYISEYGLHPFDVVLCKPTKELERLLKLHPDS